MGYACPVCSIPQADGEHLANHLAFTAIIRSGDHEAWLDEHVPEWSEHGEAELAAIVVKHAPEEEFPQVFEDTVNEDGEHQHDHERSGELFEDRFPTGREQVPGRQPAAMSPETEAIVEEARELTREMLREDDGDEAGTEADGTEDAEE